MANLQLDWSKAEVSDGKLKVSLDDKPSDEWSASFERTARLLDRGTWPEVKLKKREITVKGVESGSEERLRFFLESVVQEANGETTTEDDAEQQEDERSEDQEKAEAKDDPDQEMTDRFRAFGSSEEDSEADA